MNTEPMSSEAIQDFLEALDEAAEKLRELVDNEVADDSPAIKEYLDGSTFIEAGYTMVEHLAPDFPAVFRVMHDQHYWPMFQKTQRGQISWAEALVAVPEFLREHAENRVQQELFMDDE